jgi:hypothetical protein
MATTVLTDCKILLGGYNLSGYHNSLEISHGAEMLDDTVFGTSGTRSAKPGLLNFESNGSVFWDTELDGVVYNRIGADREVHSYAMEGNVAGDITFAIRGINATYNPLSGEVGQLLQSEFTARSSNSPLVRGQLFLPLGTPLTASGNSAVSQLGAVITGRKVYMSVHVVAVSGTTPSITFTLQSDNAVGFPSSTTQGTMTAMTAIGAQWMEVAGPITDDYWRVGYTISGTTPSFTVFVSIGIK